MSKIIKEKTKYYEYAYTFQENFRERLDFCRYMKKQMGWQEFGFMDKKWRFKDMNIITAIINKYPNTEFDPDVQYEYQKFEQQKKSERRKEMQANVIKDKTDSDITIPNIKGELYPYQKVGVEFFLNNDGRAILADTMGLGKTLTSLAYIAKQKFKKTLVIVPATMKYVWESEVNKWTKLKPYVLESGKKPSAEDIIDAFRDHDIVIINYDILKKYFDELNIIRWDCLILDEFHYIKNNKAQRTKLTKNIARNIPHVLMLSGTPLLNRPVELFNGLNVLDPQTWDNWYKYTIRYCAGHQTRYGWDVRGSSNIDELQNQISKYFLRRTKEDVLTELPPKRFIDIPVKLSNEKQFEYDLIMSSFVEYLKEIKNKNKNEIDKTLMAEHLVKLNELRQITSYGKIDVALSTIESIIDSGEKVVVFSNYIEPLEKLHKKFKKKSVIITGQTPSPLRNKLIETFQKKDNLQIFFGGIKSAGVGITLTSAANVLFLDYSWVPADHMQAADRIHRIGQESNSVTIYQLYARNTIDEYMKRILEEKKEVFDRLIEQKTFTGKEEKVNLIDDVIGKIKDTHNL